MNNNNVEYESNGSRKKISIGKTTPYWRDIITDLQNSATWKVYLTIAIHFIFSEDVNEEVVLHSKSNAIECIIRQMILLANFLNHLVRDN